MAGAPGKISSPLADPKLREAFELALDRDQINTIVYGGLQQVGCGPITSANVFYDGIPCPARDVAGSQEARHRLGRRDARSRSSSRSPNSPTNVRLAELVQSQVAEAGFALKVVPLENNTAFKNQTDGKYEIQLTPWSGRVDPDGNINRFHNTTGSDNTLEGESIRPSMRSSTRRAPSPTSPPARRCTSRSSNRSVLAGTSVIYFQ